jgi:hypothetical protein
VLSAHWAPRFTCGGKEYALVRTTEASPEERAVAVPAAEAETMFTWAFPAALLGSWFQPAGDLRRLAVGLRLWPPLEARLMRLQDIHERLRHLVAGGRLLIIQADRIPQPRPVGGPPVEQTAAETPFDAPAPRPFSWIEVHLVDKGDRPLAGVRVRLRDPEGAVREARTDERGFIRLNVPQGQCELELPGLDADSWSAEGA